MVWGMKTLSLDMRERILASCDARAGTREDVANRYRVSLGMVKKLLQQRRKTVHPRLRSGYALPPSEMDKTRTKNQHKPSPMTNSWSGTEK